MTVPNGGLKTVLCAGFAACALSVFAPALAQDAKPVTRDDMRERDKAIDARMDRFEKVLRSFREVLVQSKDTGKPVEVRLVEDPDPQVLALGQRL
ncbi:MAG: hypothetical protein ACXWVJ_09290, partial [Caulobacteraceae bacterium]